MNHRKDLIEFAKKYLGIELKMHQIIMLRLMAIYYSVIGYKYWKR